MDTTGSLRRFRAVFLYATKDEKIKLMRATNKKGDWSMDMKFVESLIDGDGYYPSIEFNPGDFLEPGETILLEAIGCPCSECERINHIKTGETAVYIVQCVEINQTDSGFWLLPDEKVKLNTHYSAALYKATSTDIPLLII